MSEALKQLQLPEDPEERNLFLFERGLENSDSIQEVNGFVVDAVRNSISTPSHKIMQMGWEKIQSDFSNDPTSPKSAAEAFRIFTETYAWQSRINEKRAEARKIENEMAQRGATGGYRAREPVNEGYDEDQFSQAVDKKISAVRNRIQIGEADISVVAKEVAEIVASSVAKAAPEEMNTIITIALTKIREKARMFNIQYDENLEKFLCAQFLNTIKENSNIVILSIKESKTKMDDIL